MSVKFSPSTKGFYEATHRADKIPPDAVEITDEYRWELINAQSCGKTITAGADGYPYLADPPPPNQTQLIQQYESALDNHLDAVAHAHRYRDREMFALRAGYVGPYQAEGIAFAQWMDTCNVQAHALLRSVIAGTTPLPTIPEMLATLPDFDLP